MQQGNYLFNSITLQKFTANFWSVLSFFIIIFFGFVALFAYVLSPDNSQNANQMQLSIHSKPPGFSVNILQIPSQKTTKQSTFQKWFHGDLNFNQIYSFQKIDITGNNVLIYPYNDDPSFKTLPTKIPLTQFAPYTTTNEITANYAKKKYFLLGTDKYGRDLLSRLLIGSRISFTIGFIAVFISLLLGIFLGSIAGYFGGIIDTIIMWVINVVWSIPTLLLVIAITLALGKGLWQVYIAVGLTMWIEVARVVRGQVISIKEQQYITAAVTLGYNHSRTLWNHILPNSLPPVIVISAANFAGAILIESGLSFLGIGAQPPIPSWGAMIKDHYSYIILGKAYLALAPGLCIMLLVTAFMLLGNGVRDILDVKK